VETAAPETLGALLNEYVGGMIDVVFAHEYGCEDHWRAIQILFNDPETSRIMLLRAIACAA